MSSIPQTSFKSAGGTIICKASFASGDAAGTEEIADMTWSARLGSQKEIIIPTSESWMLTDLYTNSSTTAGTDVNPQIEIRKDNDRLLDTSNFLDSITVGSNQRPNGLHGNLIFEGGSHMTMTAISSAAAAAARSTSWLVPYEKQG